MNQKRDLTKIFIDEIYAKPPRKNYPTNKIVVKHIDQIWSIDLLDMSDYSIKNNNGYRYIFVIIDDFSKYLFTIPLKNKNSQTITNEFSNILWYHRKDFQVKFIVTEVKNFTTLFFKIS